MERKIVFPNLLLSQNIAYLYICFPILISSYWDIHFPLSSRQVPPTTNLAQSSLGSRWYFFIWNSVYKANCSCHLCFDIVVRFRVNTLFLNLLQLCERLTEITSNLQKQQILPANTHLACLLGHRDMYKQIRLCEAGRYCIKNQACPSEFTSVSAVLLCGAISCNILPVPPLPSLSFLSSIIFSRTFIG